MSSRVFNDMRCLERNNEHGDIIGWDQSNRAYVLTHGVSGVEWSHYRRPLPEYIYQTYMKYWGDVTFK